MYRILLGMMGFSVFWNCSLLSAQTLNQNQEILLQAMTHLQQDYFNSTILTMQLKRTKFENAKSTYTAEGSTVYAQFGNQFFSEQNVKTISHTENPDPNQKPLEDCVQKYSQGEKTSLSVRFYNDISKSVSHVSAKESPDRNASKRWILSNSNLQGLDRCGALGKSYMDLVRTQPTRISSTNGIIQIEYDTPYGACFIRVDQFKRIVLSFELVQNPDSLCSIIDQKQRKLSELREAMSCGTPNGLKERRERWDFEWSATGGRWEIQSIRVYLVALADPQLSEKYESILRVTSVRHNITHQEFEALKIPLSDGQEVRVLGDTGPTTLGIQEGEVVRTADGIFGQHFVKIEPAKQTWHGWVYFLGGVIVLASLLYVSYRARRSHLSRRQQMKELPSPQP
ncbi:MAG: hypothetical protein ACRC8S_20645 [Fimbriiglobus sp.]